MRRAPIALAAAALLTGALGLGFVVTRSDTDDAAQELIRRSVQKNIAPGETTSVEVACDPGTAPTGGGFNNSPGIVVLSSFPQPDKWHVRVTNPSDTFKQAESHVVCSGP